VNSTLAAEPNDADTSSATDGPDAGHPRDALFASGTAPSGELLRLDGNEFDIVAEHVTLAEAAALAERIGRSIAPRLQVAAVTVRITASIGIAPLNAAPMIVGAPADADLAILLHLADGAIFEPSQWSRRARRP
jgi:predicted signal transduction protein with EAL and GGDEF domain